MQQVESTNFILCIPKTNRHAANCLRQLEDYRVRIINLLGSLAHEKWDGKCVVLIPPTSEEFVRYLLDYYPEDAVTALPGGVYLNHGYGHFVFPDGELTHYTPIIAHELCHALLKSDNMPAWVNEGVTQTIEHQITGMKPYFLDADIIGRHRNYWTPDLVQSFWDGTSFFFPDDGNELSYHLARFLINGLTQQGRALFLKFVSTASASDSGFSAAKECLEMDLPAIVSNFLDFEERENPDHAF